MILKKYSQDLENALFQTLEKENPKIISATSVMVNCITSGGKILVCGNGGSAAEAQHFAAELIVRFKKNRKAIPSVSLTTDTSSLTACGNDYSFNEIFSRQVEALATEKDVLLCLSTSGNSPNVVKAAEAALKLGGQVISLTGQKENALEKISNITVKVQALETSRIQEVHLFLIHYFAEIIENSVG